MKHITGEFRFRNEGDLLVLQVAEVDYSQYTSYEKEVWRDAKTEDLLNITFYKEINKYPEPITQQYKDDSARLEHKEK